MNIEFLKNTERFGVRKGMESINPDEAVVNFDNEHEVRTFFTNASNCGMNAKLIQRIATNIAPTFSHRSLKKSPELSDRECQEYLYSEIAKGNARVVLKNNGFTPETKKLNSAQGEDEQNLFDTSFSFIEKQVDQFKKICSKIYHADYYILEKIYNYDENSTGFVPSIVDKSSIQEHSTAWTSWNDPFDIAALGAFKTVVAYRISSFLKLNNSIKFAAAVGAQSELLSAQYLITGKSIITKKWYGSYAIRYDLRKRRLEIPWVKFKGSGQEERIMVELKRKDRLVFNDRPAYEHPEVMIPPFIPMEKFLSDYENGTPLPEHSSNKIMPLG